MIINILCVIIYLWVLYLQIHNLIKYKEVNGAIKTRLLLMLICMAQGTHVIKNFDSHPMYFLLLSCITMLVLYDGFNLSIFKQRKSKK